MIADVLSEIDVNDAERRIDLAERERATHVILPTRVARILLAFACLGVTPYEIEQREAEIE